MSYLTDRRRFLKTTALTGVGVFVSGTAAAEDSKSPNERIRFACIGVGGKGTSDSADAKRARRRRGHLRHRRQHAGEGRRKSFPKAHTLQRLPQDARRDGQEHRRGHRQHARPHARPGRGHGHADGQGLLHAEAADAHDLRSPQARRDRPRDERRHADGQPGHVVHAAAQDGRRDSRRACWATSRKSTSGRIGRSGRRADRVRPKRRCPSNVHWDLWLGPAPYRPYAPGYHPFAWRGWWDFGSGALGDMACHTVNMPFMALDLRDPMAVQATTSGHNRDSYPEVVGHHLRFSGQRQSPGPEDVLVRRRQEARRPTCSTTSRSARPACC